MSLAASGQRAGEPPSPGSAVPSRRQCVCDPGCERVSGLGLWAEGRSVLPSRGLADPPPGCLACTPASPLAVPRALDCRDSSPARWVDRPASRWGPGVHLCGNRPPCTGPVVSAGTATRLPVSCPEAAGLRPCQAETSHERSEGLSTCQSCPGVHSQCPRARWHITVVGCARSSEARLDASPRRPWGRVPEHRWLPWPGRGRGACLLSVGVSLSPRTGRRCPGGLGVLLLPPFLASDSVAGVPAFVFGGSGGRGLGPRSSRHPATGGAGLWLAAARSPHTPVQNLGWQSPRAARHQVPVHQISMDVSHGPGLSPVGLRGVLAKIGICCQRRKEAFTEEPCFPASARGPAPAPIPSTAAVPPRGTVPVPGLWGWGLGDRCRPPHGSVSRGRTTCSDDRLEPRAFA